MARNTTTSELASIQDAGFGSFVFFCKDVPSSVIPCTRRHFRQTLIPLQRTMVQPLLSSSRPPIIPFIHYLTIPKLSNTNFTLEDPATAPVGINPVCGIPRAGNSRLGNIAVRIYYHTPISSCLVLPHSLSERRCLWSFRGLGPLSHTPLQQA